MGISLKHSYFVIPFPVEPGSDFIARTVVKVREAILDTGWMRYSGDLNVSYTGQKAGHVDLVITHSVDDEEAVLDAMMPLYQR